MVPEQPEVEKWWSSSCQSNGVVSPSSSSANGLVAPSYDELVKKAALKEALLGELTRLGKENDLKPFEQVKDIHVSGELWSVENDLLTPTFKVKRNALKNAFQSQIDAMYSQLW